MSRPIVTRRTVLSSAAGVTAAATLGIGISGCGGTSDPGNSSSRNQGIKLPAYVPYTGVRPDYPANAMGVQDGYRSYPSERPRLYDKAPGSGGEIHADGIISLAPSPVTKNAFWQEMNKRLGVTLKFSVSTSADHARKLATTVAGGDYPDFLQIRTSIGELPNTPEILKAHFTDLTEYLSGDAVKKYPSLANIPTRSWKSCLFNGGIYALPISRPTFGGVTYIRSDLANAKGLNYKVTSPDDYLELCKALTDPKSNKWAVGGPINHMFDIQSWFGCPNWWAQKDGKFTSIFETDNMRGALDFANKMFKAGVFHPDAFAADSTTALTWLRAGTTAIFSSGSAGYIDYMTGGREQNPNFDVDLIPPFAADGGTPRLSIADGIYSVTAIKKGTPAKVEELLRIADWLAAPFGTEEYTVKTYGVEGTHYTWKDGQPTAKTDGGTKADKSIPVGYICSAPPVLYSAKYPDRVAAQHELETQFLKNVREDASLGLYSDTKAKNWPAVNTNLNKVIGDVIQGRKNLSEWDEAVATYQDKIDAIRTDLEAAYRAANP